MNKYPIVITYKRTQDNGQELRYTLRSLKNIKNWNGDVWIVGDKPDWIQNVNHITGRRSHHPYIDQEYAMLAVLAEPSIPDDFIYSMDDVYVVKPLKIVDMHQGDYLTSADKRGYHHNQKKVTCDWLNAHGYTTLDYELHTPMLLNKQKRMEIHNILKPTMNGVMMKPRTLYGNIFSIGGDFYIDAKTKTHELPDQPIISTQFYTDQLDKLFPEPSIFEADRV